MTQAVTTPIKDLVPRKTIDYDTLGYVDVSTILAIRDLLQEATTILTEWRPIGQRTRCCYNGQRIPGYKEHYR